jgi:hypothetical protein
MQGLRLLQRVIGIKERLFTRLRNEDTPSTTVDSTGNRDHN